MMPWRTFIARAGAASGLFGYAMFAALRLAGADPGGPTTPRFTFAGVLRNADGSLPTAARTARLTFTFTKVGAPAGTAPCTTDASASIAVGGAFTADVSIAGCARFFDGSTITYTVSEGGAMLTSAPVPVTPVPYARFADQAGGIIDHDCPSGYVRVRGDTTVLRGEGVILCRRGRDEVVKVGDGASAYWIDRYEATVWGTPDGTGMPLNSESDTLATLLPRNGMWSSTAPAGTRPRPPAYALSVGGAFRPGRNVTWFQGSALCRASGKRLPTGEEWLRAAHDTADDETRCHIATSNTNARNTGDGARCHSLWGAQDMIGNVGEWTDEWYAGNGATMPVNGGAQNWPSDYNMDGTWNIEGFVERGGGGALGIPSAALRGGDWGNGPRAGVFALDLTVGPSAWYPVVGFRCVVPG